MRTKLSSTNHFSKTYLGKLRTKIGTDLVLSPGARILIFNQRNELLLQLRSDFKVWGLPGGSREVEESIFECIQREVLEETGLNLLNAQACAFSSKPEIETIIYPNNDKVQGFSLIFFASANDWNGSLKTDIDESLDLQFFPMTQLPEIYKLDQYSLKLFSDFQKTNQFQVG